MEKPSPGKLIHLRDREWVVLPSDDPDVLMVRPLGGSQDETTGIYLPLAVEEDRWQDAKFPEPGPDDIDDFETARMLFDAARLSFRNASGPFRCMGKLSFRPRSYQVVPLVMSLKQEVTRLLIADDVGIGKTIEALMILKEMMERGEIKRFAVICLPHLCEQWQKELKDKLDIDAEIIRSSTVARLERKLPDDRSVFHHVPYQVISIDYIKSDRRKPLFLNDCPELVILDEAHTCARPAQAESVVQQQRHHLMHKVAADPNRHMVFLTATPHSGKDPEFLSLLGLLNKDLESLELDKLDQSRRRRIARHFIQRKRESIKRWLNEDTPFPDRDSKEVAYKLSSEYQDFFMDIHAFARGLTNESEKKGGPLGKYWAALALLRGIMSSPAAGYEMLKGRIQRKTVELSNQENGDQNREENPVLKAEAAESDSVMLGLLENADFSASELDSLRKFARSIQQLYGIKKDYKVGSASRTIKSWVSEGYQPIVFCKYIATAHYVGEVLAKELPQKVDVQVVTSELADEQRREVVEAMGDSPHRVLVATDCLSEGINLQQLFNAVLHYDLPWNPNRIEQREGRVDRFGQPRKMVKTQLLWGEDNPIDSIVLKVLIKKVRDIQRAIGVAINLGEDNESIMNAVLKEVLLDPQKAMQASQLQIEFDDGISQADQQITNELEQARKKAENLRSIFAHESIPPKEIEADLKAVDEAIGDVESVQSLVTYGISHLGGSVKHTDDGHIAFIRNLPPHLKEALNTEDKKAISFESPTPEGYQYIGRNHSFTEHLCQMLMALAFEQKDSYRRMARASVIRTSMVERKTTLVQFRVRNVIKEVKTKSQHISEEMYLWGFEGVRPNGSTLTYDHCKKLLFQAESQSGLRLERQKQELNDQLTVFDDCRSTFRKMAEERAEELVEAHSRFKELVGGKRYEAVYPVLPPDVMGIYVFLPVPQTL
ncbi:helicase-related protein [Balneolaceae bacterium ANBcel3]|nr:helicase-related protein [Balneolaceae bacterium ANBcel3]